MDSWITYRGQPVWLTYQFNVSSKLHCHHVGCDTLVNLWLICSKGPTENCVHWATRVLLSSLLSQQNKFLSLLIGWSNSLIFMVFFSCFDISAAFMSPLGEALPLTMLWWSLFCRSIEDHMAHNDDNLVSPPQKKINKKLSLRATKSSTAMKSASVFL